MNTNSCYYINFNKLQIKKILPDEITSKTRQITINLGNLDPHKSLTDCKTFVLGKLTNAALGNSNSDVTDKPLFLHFAFETAAVADTTDEDFMSAVSLILNCFAHFNSGIKRTDREYHLDCPRAFIPYLNLNRHMSKQFTNCELRFPKFNLDITLPLDDESSYTFELLNAQKLAAERIETLNAR